jgi:hypothetical protein
MDKQDKIGSQLSQILNSSITSLTSSDNFYAFKEVIPLKNGLK